MVRPELPGRELQLHERARPPATDSIPFPPFGFRGCAREIAATDDNCDAAVPADELARFGLTDRERDVLALLAAGQSNPEIARAKLGVRRRGEAAALAHPPRRHRTGLHLSTPAQHRAAAARADPLR